jgi:hypothetical protein
MFVVTIEWDGEFVERELSSEFNLKNSAKATARAFARNRRGDGVTYRVRPAGGDFCESPLASFHA